MFRTKDATGTVKYISRSKATVIDNRDPLKRGRIRVDHPLLGKTGWVDYLKDPNSFNVPNIGDIVFVEAEVGNPEFAVCSGVKTQGKIDKPTVPDEFQRDVPTNRGMKTPNGQMIEFDDGEAEYTANPTDNKFTDKSKGIRITSSTGNKIHINEEDKYIIIEDANGNFIKLDYESDALIIEVAGNIEVKAAGTKIDSPDNEITGNLKVGGNEEIAGNTQVTGNLKVVGNSELGGGVPLVLATANFVGTDSHGVPVISSMMSGQTTKSTSS